MAEYVLDPAVACRWFFPTAQTKYVVESRGLLDGIAGGKDIAHVPSVFLYEVSAWLADEGSRSGLDVERAAAALRALPFVEHPLDGELMPAAFLAARRHRVDFHTACYLALAEKLIVPYLCPNDDLVQRLTGETRIAGLAVR
jgi:predicted nucleic acid-binding protein